MNPEQIILYCIAIFAVSIVPGPSMALAFAEGAKGGMNGALPAAFGNLTASLGQATIAFFVFRSVISLRQDLLLAMQGIGAIYIAYVGYVFIRHVGSFRLECEERESDPARRALQFQSGFLIAFFNPKAILFFAALFPQFVSAGVVASPDYLISVFLPIGSIALLCFLTYGYLGHVSVRIFDDGKVFRLFVPASGVFLVIAAVLGLAEIADRM